LLVAVAGLALAAAARGAVAPRLGRWAGGGPDGRIQFAVSRVRGTYVFSDLVVSCQAAAGPDWDDANEEPIPPDGYQRMRRSEAAIRSDGQIDQNGSPDFRAYNATALSGTLAGDGGTVTVDGRAADDNPNGTGYCPNGPLRHVRVHPIHARIVRDGVYRMQGSSASEGVFYVFGEGALIEWTAGFGTPIGGIEDDPALCAETPVTASFPAAGFGLGVTDANVILTSQSGAFSLSLTEDSLGMVDTATFSGAFVNSSAAAGTYTAVNDYPITCAGAGTFTLSLYKPAAKLVPMTAQGQPAPKPPPPPPKRHRHHHPLRTVRYVALGDSYSAGEGVPPYRPGTDTLRDRCHRSTRAYSRLVSRAGLVPGVRFSTSFYACSGATTANVLSTSRFGEQPQITRPALRRAHLVTISIGGNDAGFSRVVAACSRLAPRACYRGPTATKLLAGIENLRGTLSSTYDAIRAEAAPGAKIIVLDYPNLFPTHSCGKLRSLFPLKAQAFLRRAGAVLDDTIRLAAGDAHVQFVDVRAAFAGHELCSSDEWLDFLVAPRRHRVTAVTGSFHPNARGQAAYARVLLGVLRREF